MGLSLGFGQTQITNPAGENLEEQFVDPLTTLPQVFLKDEFSPVNYGIHELKLPYLRQHSASIRQQASRA
jgi:hypothetical protein